MSSGAGDVRGFYAALGIQLPAWASSNAMVRCFANPEVHAHEDARPSCSISVEHGAWQCWACGARGGAYDAALARGHTPASAMELAIGHGLAERRPETPLLGPQRVAHTHAQPAPPVRRVPLAATETDAQAWHRALFSDRGGPLRQRLSRERLWRPETMRELGLGYDGTRITIPIRDGSGALRGVLRYRLGASTPKMLAVRGTRLGLIPHPASQRSRRILLVEGPPDMIAARSRGWPAIAVPGDHAWRPQWARLLADRELIVLMDSDAAGRDAAGRIAADLEPYAAVRVVDLAPARRDGYDLTDWLITNPQPRRTRCVTSSLSTPTITR